MITDQTLNDLNLINRLLDEAEAAKRQPDRDAKLVEALRTSERALELLLSDPKLSDTLSSAGAVAREYREEMVAAVSDLGLYRAFVNTEARLLRDFGVDPALADRLADQLWAVRQQIIESDIDSGGLATALGELRGALADAAGRVNQRESASEIRGVLRRVLVGAGGVLLVSVNGVAGAAGAPVTGGLTLAGAALSIAGGSIMIDRATKGILEF